MRILIRTNADVDASAAACESRWGIAGIFKTFPHRLQHQPLLRLDPHCFARRYAKDFRFELVDAVEESSVTGVDLAGGIWIGIVILVDIKPVVGYFPDRVHSARQ